jgi:hypothetical protein
MGGRAEGPACADPGTRTPIGVSGNTRRLLKSDNNFAISTNFENITEHKFNLTRYEYFSIE